MKDPLRIPGMVDALTRLWEARPDLTLTRLLGLLETHGADWNATDEETLAVLQRLAAETPDHIDGTGGRYLVTTEDATGRPGQLVTVGAGRVAVRRIPGSRTDAVHDLPQPVVWSCSGVRTCRVARPLVITDTEGFDHRFGLVSSIRVITAPGKDGTGDAAGDAEVTSLDGLRRRTLDGVYLLELADDAGPAGAGSGRAGAGSGRAGASGASEAGASASGASGATATVLLDRSLWIFTTGRRDLHRERLHWARLLDATVGAPLRIALDGGEVRELPVLRRITRLE